MNEQNKIILYQDDNEITQEFEIYRKREMDLLENDFDREIKKLKNQ